MSGNYAEVKVVFEGQVIGQRVNLGGDFLDRRTVDNAIIPATNSVLRLVDEAGG